jgi:hypothetical protein
VTATVLASVALGASISSRVGHFRKQQRLFLYLPQVELSVV